MNLFPIELESKIPKLYSTERIPTGEKIAVAKYFSRYTGWKWYVVEGDWEGEDYIFFGFTQTYDEELAFFSLMELDNVCVNISGRRVPAVERDVNFKPVKLKEIMEHQY